jgi:ubiquinone biosynthesis protein
VNPFELISNVGRAREIAAVLIRNGYADLLQKLEPPAGWLQRFTPRPRERLSAPVRLRTVLEELGPTFVKFGQMLSMRPDLLPEPFILELRRLQDRVKPQPFTELQPVLRAALEADEGEVFSEFDPAPVASGSLAQVYRATLRENGLQVAVKVQRPGITKVIESDFELLRWFARQAHERVDQLRPYNLPAIIAELREGIERELDFRIEAHNAMLFLAQYASSGTVTAARPVEDRSSRTVLVMEWVDGVKPTSLESGSEAARSVARNGAESIFRQILLDGFFHADPHGGNLMVLPDARVCFLDWGLVGQLTQRMRYSLIDLFAAFLQGDSAQVVRVAGDLGRPAGGRPDPVIMEPEVLHAIRASFDPETGQGEVGRAMLRLLHIFGAHGIEVSRDYALVAKAVLSIEEAGRQLDPDFDLQANFRPVLEAVVRERRDPRRIWRSVRRSVLGGLGRVQDLPAELQRLLRMLQAGQVTLNFQHRGLEKLDDSVSDASNKMTVGMIIASLIIGSSLIVTTRVPPLLFGYPALGIIGYLLSALLGVWVVIDILRRSRRR